MPIKVEDVPFLLPEGWVWTRLGDLCSSITYGTSKSCSYNESLNSKILRIPNVSSGSIDDTDLKYTELSGEEIRELSLANGDILMIRSNGSTEIVGTMAYVSEKFTGYCFAGYLIRLRFCVPIIGKFLSRISKSALIRAYIQMPLRTTVGINNINTQEISNIPIPLPPLAEQRAIVLRVEEILSMIDGLEAQVKERKGQTEGVLQVVLREVFEGVDLK
jgi:type I restriction enzyme S subunit